ncbi:UNVERIFIED_CONTAM: hypothetical protein GTU68_060524 [Idotea baltica]|nr:hypothetical protein [Idotea baltica]
MAAAHSFPKSKIKILLLEKIHSAAEQALVDSGFAVETIDRALSAEELLERIPEVHVLGVRSKTVVREEHLAKAKRLLAIGSFGVGTNHIDLEAAARFGIPVFNAPYGNTRSVAELAMSNIIALARQSFEKSARMHNGEWLKTATGVFEVRGKTLGIVGYGHIGGQISVIAESLGLNVVFFDKNKKLAMSNARQLSSLEELLGTADFVTLHIPALQDGGVLISATELSQMKPGSYLINSARGSLVDIDALAESLKSGHLAGAAVDVFPDEPKSNQDPFISPLCKIDNVILTPHIGGSTEEAQFNIGVEVAAFLERFIDEGSSVSAVNFPQVELPSDRQSHRVLNIHRNVPGVLSNVNSIISEAGTNITGQYLATNNDLGYLVIDLADEMSDIICEKIEQLDSSIRTRKIY